MPQVRCRRPPTIGPQRAWQLSMYQQVHEQVATGKTQKEIARALHIHPQTVRKYLRQETFQDRRHNPHPSPVEPYRAYLQTRWAQGCCVMKTLWLELQEQGFTGSYDSVWHFLRTWPLPEEMQLGTHPSPSPASKRAKPATRTPRQTMWLLLQPPERLCEADVAYREVLLRIAPPLATLATLGRDFVQMIRQRQCAALLPWLEKARTCGFGEVQRFALDLSKEGAAVQAALSTPWSTGQVEGQITRLKLIKRQMYGRAHLDLLRLRVLHAA